MKQFEEVLTAKPEVGSVGVFILQHMLVSCAQNSAFTNCGRKFILDMKLNFYSQFDNQ